MSYIGNQPTSVAFLTDQFSGTGSQTAFTLSAAPANTASILVAVSGVLQDPTTYSTSGLTLTFSAAPPSGTGNISVRYLGIPASNITTTAYSTRTDFTATAGQTTFTVPSYTVNFIQVYRNGVLLGSADYTATTGTTVVLATAATAGDLVTTISFYVSSVLGAIPATSGAVTDSYILSMAGSKLTGTQTIPATTLPTGSVLQVVSSTFQGTQFSNSGVFANTGFSVSITPKSATSKILVRMAIQATSAANGMGFAIYRNGSVVWNPSTADGSGSYGQYPALYAFSIIEYLDSPATTSATTYALYMQSRSGSTSVVNPTAGSNNGGTTVTVMEIAA